MLLQQYFVASYVNALSLYLSLVCNFNKILYRVYFRKYFRFLLLGYYLNRRYNKMLDVSPTIEWNIISGSNPEADLTLAEVRFQDKKS